jgi:hypothetical protein
MSAMLVCVPAALKQKIFDSQQSISLALISQFNYGVSPVCVCINWSPISMEVSCCSPCCFFPSPTHTDIFECCDLFDQVLLKRKKSRGELNSQLLASFNHLHIKCTASRWIYEYVNRHRRKIPVAATAQVFWLPITE